MRQSLILPALVCLCVCACIPQAENGKEGRNFDEYDIAMLQDAMETGELSARELADHYLERIARFDREGPELRSIIEINPEARAIADALDAERHVSGPRGPLHGIPVVLKANIDTGDKMASSAGSLALANHHADADAFLVKQLRKAGAVILAKTNLSEWANFRSNRSSSGWSSIGGQTKNPYDPLRNPCGSSAGSAVAVAANFTVLAVGTETDGSVVCPASINGIVGIKPTLGLVSRGGIIPLAHSQDTAGPMARTVKDAAIMLSVMSAMDTRDPASSGRPRPIPDYASDLKADALVGKRIGVIRSYSGAGENPYLERSFEETIELLRSGGAVIVDPIKIDTEGMGDAEYEVLLYEFKADLNNYLSESNAPIASLAEIIEFNTEHAETVMPFFGQDIMELADSKGPLTDLEYLDALQKSKQIARDNIDDNLARHDLDAIIAPSNGPAWMTDHVNGGNYSVGSSALAAVSGYANVTVPSGYVFDLPVGVSFMGGAYSEQTLIQIAYAFEQAGKVRRAPVLE